MHYKRECLLEEEYKVKNILGKKEIDGLKETEKILVNTNRLYWRLAEITRKNEERGVLEKLVGVLKRVSEQQEMYVEMEVKDVRLCFRNEFEKLPINTFLHFKNME